MIEYFCLFPIYFIYVYKVTVNILNYQKKIGILTVLKIKNLKYGLKMPRF